MPTYETPTTLITQSGLVQPSLRRVAAQSDADVTVQNADISVLDTALPRVDACKNPVLVVAQLEIRLTVACIASFTLYREGVAIAATTKRVTLGGAPGDLYTVCLVWYDLPPNTLPRPLYDVRAQGDQGAVDTFDVLTTSFLIADA